MRVLWITILLTFLTIAAESKNGWQKGKASWHKHKDGEDGYHKHKDGDQGSTNGGKTDANGQEANENGANGQGTNGKDTNNGNSNGQTPRPTPSRTVSDNPEEAFQDLARQVIADDQISSKYCKKNQLTGATEIYGIDYYKLIIPIQDNDPDNIVVKIKHRVIYIKGETPDIDQRWSSDDEHHFNYVKVLPGFVDITMTTWDIKNLKIIVTIPYKIKFNSEQTVVCDKDGSTQEITVPRGGIGRETVELDKIEPKKEEDKTVPNIDQQLLDKIFGI